MPPYLQLAARTELISSDQMYTSQLHIILTNLVPSHEKLNLGSGVKTQKEMLLLSKKDKTQFSWASDVGVFYSITGTRFPYYISVRTI